MDGLPENARMVEIQFVDIALIMKTNSKLDEKRVKKMVDDGINPKDMWAIVPAYRLPGGMMFMITDGNHRVEALRRRGFRWIPVAELTKKEFDHVKFSKDRSTNLAVKLVEHPRYWIHLGNAAGGGISVKDPDQVAKYI